MPPRYAYWTILVDNAPTAFRSGSKEELLPTFNRLKEKHASAVMMWWQNGKLWPSRLDAQEAMRARGEIGRRNDSRQADRKPAGRSFGEKPARRSFSEGGQPFRSEREQKPFRERHDRGERAAWSPKPQAPRPKPSESGKLDWKPKGEFTPAPKRADREGGSDWKPNPDWKPRADAKPEWRPKSQKSEAEGRGPRRSAEREGGPDWKPKGSFAPQARRPQARKPYSEKPDWKPKGSFDPEARRPQARKPFSERKSPGAKLDWTPKSGYTDKADRPVTEKRQWVPKAEYKKALGIEPKKDSKWRPGGEHRDPKQKYKDAKKAKWTQYKQTIRKRWEAKGGKKREE
jgi:hypothetical protein